MNNPTDGAVNAPVPKLRMERQGSTSEVYTRRWPEVRAGVCEFCGTLDPNQPPQYQYKLCSHFRGMGDIRCSYCPDHKNPEDVVGHSTLNVHQHPVYPDQVIAVCNSFECSDKHLKRFKINQ